MRWRRFDVKASIRRVSSGDGTLKMNNDGNRLTYYSYTAAGVHAVRRFSASIGLFDIHEVT